MPERPINVMLVDDSAVVRNFTLKVISQDPALKIISTAYDGQNALDKLSEKSLADIVDVIVLDIEMPRMDGITALPHLLKAAPFAEVLICSTLSTKNAKISMKALELGACDYITKPTALGEGNALENFSRELTSKIKAFGEMARKGRDRGTNKQSASPLSSPAQSPAAALKLSSPSSLLRKPRALAIGSSTGGPQALIALFTSLKGRLSDIPIFITQHMPPSFTTILAEHISKYGERACVEATEGMTVEKGVTYLAPGDFHMLPTQAGDKTIIRLTKDAPENFCRPAVDPMLRSLVKIYGDSLLTVILTGMGSDGLSGAKEAVAKGGAVLAQDEASSVVWGMPGAVAKEGICRAVLPLSAIGPEIIKIFGGAK